jgi:hypothetical protein
MKGKGEGEERMTTRIVGRRQVKGVLGSGAIQYDVLSRGPLPSVREHHSAPPRPLRVDMSLRKLLVDVHDYLYLPSYALVRRLLGFLRATRHLVRVKVLILDDRVQPDTRLDTIRHFCDLPR